MEWNGDKQSPNTKRIYDVILLINWIICMILLLNFMEWKDGKLKREVLKHLKRN